MFSRITLSIALFYSICAFAQNGADRGGVDPIKTRQATIQNHIQNNLKEDLRKFFDFLSVNEIKDAATRALFEQLLHGGIKSDLAPTPYQIAVACKDSQKHAYPAATDIGGRRHAICFDTKKLAELYLAADQETLRMALASIAIHEHAHQFGMNEALATQVGAEVAIQFELQMAKAADQAKVVRKVKNPKAGSQYVLQAAELLWLDFPNGRKIAVGCDVFQDEWQRYAYDVSREPEMTYRFGSERKAFFHPATGGNYTSDAWTSGQRGGQEMFEALGRWLTGNSLIVVICKEQGRVLSPISARDVNEKLTDRERRKRIHSCYVTRRERDGPGLFGDKYYWIATLDGEVVKKVSDGNKSDAFAECRKMDEEGQCVCYDKDESAR